MNHYVHLKHQSILLPPACVDLSMRMVYHMHMEKEIWKPVVGHWPYLISNHGRIKSNSGEIKKIRKDRNGYQSVALYNRGSVKYVGVHRLVAKSFISNPEGKAYVNHKDFDKTNNKVENLEWTTPIENNLHARKNGRYPINEDHPRSKLTLEAVREMKNKKTRSPQAVKEYSERFAVSEACIRDVLWNRRWKNV